MSHLYRLANQLITPEACKKYIQHAHTYMNNWIAQDVAIQQRVGGAGVRVGHFQDNVVSLVLDILPDDGEVDSSADESEDEELQQPMGEEKFDPAEVKMAEIQPDPLLDPEAQAIMAALRGTPRKAHISERTSQGGVLQPWIE